MSDTTVKILAKQNSILSSKNMKNLKKTELVVNKKHSGIWFRIVDLEQIKTKCPKRG